mgnify:CR=1 FL=1
MKIEKRQEVIETTVYIAEDGTEFGERADCVQYEGGDLVVKAKERLSQLPQFCIEPPACDYYADYAWVRLEKEEDLKALQLAEFHHDSTAHEYYAPFYPCWVLYHVDDVGDGYISGTPGQFAKECSDYITDVTKKIREMEHAAEN